jgi:hypothetical protein
MFYFCSVPCDSERNETMGGIGNLLWTIPTLAAASCAPATGLASNGNAAATAEQVALKSATALSLAELAYNSGEAAATAAVRSGALSSEQDRAIGAAVRRARAYRDEARALVAAGDDASSAIESLDVSLGDVDALAHPARQ